MKNMFSTGNLRMPRVLFMLCVAGSPALAQLPGPRPWQRLQNPTAAEVQRRWMEPPPEYGPEPYYGLNGPVTLDTIRHDLDTMQSLGFRAVTAQYGFGSDRPYLSQQYFDFFRQFVLEAKKRNMRVWIVDDAGYPSGFAGGKFTSEHPELRMQALVATRIPVTGGGTLDQPLPSGTVAVTAVRNGSNEAHSLPVSGDTLHWIAPPGDWTVSIVQHVFKTSPTRSDTNPKRVKDGSQSLEDYLNPAATAQYLAFTHDAYKKAVGDEFGKTILGFRGDEPDYSLSGLPWTDRFFAAFQKTKGYDIRPWLAFFLQPKEITLTPEQLRARADYYDVFADLFRDGFFKPQAEWCAANGLEYQVHLNHEEQQIALAHSEGDFFRDMRFVQVPGIDTIWHQIWTDTLSDFPRFASSAAHVYGHPRAFTESFAAYRPLPDVRMARYILNEQFVRGINLVETMYFPATSTPGHGGPMEFMRDPAYPDLMHYTGRMSFLMSMGRPAAEVGLLLPAESLWMGDIKADDTFVSTERLLSEHQIDFDILDEDAVGGLLKAEPGTFVSGSGNRYRTVIVPRADLLPIAVVDRLQTFAQSGGKVIFLDQTPSNIAGQNDLHATPARPGQFSWATVLPANLPPTPTPPAQPPPSAPAPMEVAPALLSAIQSSVPPQGVSLSRPDTSLRVTRRSLKDASVFLIFNESDKPFSNELTLQGPGHVLEEWDPQTGRVQRPPHAAAARSGEIRLPLDLEPYAIKVLVVRQ